MRHRAASRISRFIQIVTVPDLSVRTENLLGEPAVVAAQSDVLARQIVRKDTPVMRGNPEQLQTRRKRLTVNAFSDLFFSHCRCPPCLQLLPATFARSS